MSTAAPVFYLVRRSQPQKAYVDQSDLELYLNAGFDVAEKFTQPSATQGPEYDRWQDVQNRVKARDDRAILGEEFEAYLSGLEEDDQARLRSRTPEAIEKEVRAQNLLDSFVGKLNQAVDINGTQVPIWALAGVGLGSAGVLGSGIYLLADSLQEPEVELQGLQVR